MIPGIEYLYVNFIADEPIYFPRSAADSLLSRRVLLPEQVEIMDDYTLVLDPNPTPVSTTNNSSQTIEQAIKGKTTFQEVLDWGVEDIIIKNKLT